MKQRSKGTLSDFPQIIFMGTPDFSVPCLKALLDHGYALRAVVTQPDRPKGRGKKMLPSPVKRAALDFGLDILQPETVSSTAFHQAIRSKDPDIIVVVAFGQILKRDLLQLPRLGVLNIHASLLPKYRGAAPIHHAILNDEEKTGLTAMKMTEGLDSGPILLQEETPIRNDETAGQLHDRLAQMAGGFLIKTMKGLAENTICRTAGL